MTSLENQPFVLNDGSRIAVVGGGPAGSFFCYFSLLFAERSGLRLEVDVYEPRDFQVRGPSGCNMCGGIVSESLVQTLALEGIELPDTVVQRAIESYVLHTAEGATFIETPLHEKRIAAVHRGGGPRTLKEKRWDSFDGHLLDLALARGARLRRARVTGIAWADGRPVVTAGKLGPESYDLVVGAVGVNSSELKLFEDLGVRYQRPRTVKTFITEIELGGERVQSLFGNSMHVFLLPVPRLRFAALIPKGDYVTLCLLGDDIDKNLVEAFLGHPAVSHCFPTDWRLPADACHCGPRMYLGPARNPFADRVVLIGDSAVARLCKDGIGAAYRTAKAAALTAVFSGVSAADFRRHYLPQCRRLHRDNLIGQALFGFSHLMQGSAIGARALLRTVIAERARPGKRRYLSGILWDLFTGSAPYAEAMTRALNPAFLARLAVETAAAVVAPAADHKAAPAGHPAAPAK